MKTVFTLGIACALSLSAQTQTPAPAPPAAAPAAKQSIEITPGAAPNSYQLKIPVAKFIPIMQLPADFVVATANGQKVTAGQLQVILRNLPPQFQQKVEADRKEFVTQYCMLMRLVEIARQEKLDQQSPYKDNIEYQTWVVLQQAAAEQKQRELEVSADDVKKFYDDNQDRYTQVKFKAIYIPFNAAQASQADSNGKPLLTEAEAQAKAADLVKQARAGADFVKLVKENSGDPTSVAKDGDFPPALKSDMKLPAEIKKALFETKPGEVSDPVRQGKGFYIFRIQEAGLQPLDQVQKSITDELRNQQLKKWLDDLKRSIEVKLQEEPAAQAAAAPSASVAPPQK